MILSYNSGIIKKSMEPAGFTWKTVGDIQNGVSLGMKKKTSEERIIQTKIHHEKYWYRKKIYAINGSPRKILFYFCAFLLLYLLSLNYILLVNIQQKKYNITKFTIRKFKKLCFPYFHLYIFRRCLL